MKSSFQLRKAFTIAELLLVVGVMAIVLALAAPSLYDEVGPLSKHVSLDSITYSDPELENDVVLYATFNPHTNTIRICGNDGDGVPVSKLSDLKWSDIGDAINTDVFDKRDNN